MSYTFDRIKQKVEESTELLDAKKVDIGFCYFHTKVILTLFAPRKMAFSRK